MENPLADALDDLSWQFSVTAADTLRQEILLVGHSYQSIQGYLELIVADMEDIERLLRKRQAQAQARSRTPTVKRPVKRPVKPIDAQQYRPSPLSQSVIP